MVQVPVDQKRVTLSPNFRLHVNLFNKKQTLFVCLFVFSVVRRYVTANLGLNNELNLTHLATWAYSLSSV